MVIRVPETSKGEGYAALDDRMLVLDFQSGHPEAFVEVHRRYAGLAHHVCRRFLTNGQDAEEAFQETMIRVFQGLYRFNGAYSLQPWVARIATNVSLDMLRAQARRPKLDDHAVEDREDADQAEGPEEAVERLVERDLVLSVLADLPDTHRRALVFRELEGLSHREIADAMEISPGQAKALIHRAKGSFRRRWMEKVVERGGLAGIALLPLVWLGQLMGGARRLAERVVHIPGAADAVAGSAAPSVVPLGERVAAAAVTVLVAGSVTVGAAVVVNRQRADRVERAAAPVVREETAPAPVVAPPAEEERAEGRRRGSEEVGVTRPPQAQSATPTASPTTDATPSPTTDPSASPSPSTEPSPTTPPAPPPPPAWAGSFAVDWTSQDECDCGPGVELASTSSSGALTAETSLTVSQSLRGAARDAEGDAAWKLSAQLDAELGSSSGLLKIEFELASDDGEGHYTMAASSPTIVGVPGSEAVTFVFQGRYTSVGAGNGPIPNEGQAELRISVWSDGISITQVDFSAAR